MKGKERNMNMYKEREKYRAGTKQMKLEGKGKEEINNKIGRKVTKSTR
jgi:hypothetical protein